jgi:hypothetical protein
MDETYIEKLASIPHAEYQKLLYGEWLTPTKHELLLEELAKEYHDKCDAYDRRRCTAISPRTGEPIPENFRQQAAINDNARRVIDDILTHYGITQAELHQAIVAYGRKYRR